jgi:hypothetical protein
MLTKFRQLGVVASAVASRATSIDVLVGMRVLQFIAVAPMLSLGAGSLAECYDARERGLKVSRWVSLYEIITDSKATRRWAFTMPYPSWDRLSDRYSVARWARQVQADQIVAEVTDSPSFQAGGWRSTFVSLAPEHGSTCVWTVI